MKNLQTMSVNVYQSATLDNKSYVTTIEMPMYKQITRTAKYLKKYIELQRKNDVEHQRMRLYYFRMSTDDKTKGFTFSETTLNLWD